MISSTRDPIGEAGNKENRAKKKRLAMEDFLRGTSSLGLLVVVGSLFIVVRVVLCLNFFGSLGGIHDHLVLGFGTAEATKSGEQSGDQEKTSDV